MSGSTRDAGPSIGPSAPAGADRWSLRALGRMAVRALDPRLTARLRAERQQRDLLSRRLRAGGSIVVAGSPPGGRYTVAALVTLALARFQGPNVLAVDVGDEGGLYRRLATRPGGSAESVLTGLGIRAAEPGGPPRGAVGPRWLRRQLALADGFLLLAADPATGEPAIRGEEYVAAVPALGRYVSAVVTDAPRLDDESMASTVIATADRVVLVGADDDAGRAWVRSCLPWIGSVLRRPVDRSVVVALVPTPTSGPDDRRIGAGDFDVPAFRLPDDPVLHRPQPLRWDLLAPRTRRAVSALAAAVVSGLEMN
ncbi:hypothetical protein ACNTMW_20190 [Planosporangium sp. 12N6]|uniref:hypothetical protein n=1 Tax=Planosporangium spinosum TaxID=3402278 RepID=UPI003CF0575F